MLFVLFVIAFCVKILSVVYLSYLTTCSAPQIAEGRLAVTTGDTFSYLGSIDNYIEKGEYFFVNLKGERAFAGRMPYYGITYYIFRLFTNQRNAYDLIILFQILLESISIVLLSIIAYNYIKSAFAFYGTYFIMLISLNATTWAFYLFTESYSISLLIVFLYFHQRYLTPAYRNYKNLFLSGLFLSLVVLLKSYFILLFIAVGIEFLVTEYRKEVSNLASLEIVKNVFIVSIPLFLLLSPWIIRNYNLYSKFVPFQYNMYADYGYSKSELASRDFIAAWGGSFIYWDKKSAGCYFIPKADISCEFEFPSYAFARGYTMADIEKVRKSFISLQNNFSDSLDYSVAKKFQGLTALFKRGNPLRYYVITPLILTKNFLLHSGSYYLPINSSFPCYKSYQFLIKLTQSILYYLTLVLGSIGLILLFNSNKMSFMLPFVLLLLLVLFPLVFRAIEWRYFTHSYPILVVGTVSLFNSILIKVFKSNVKKEEI